VDAGGSPGAVGTAGTVAVAAFGAALSGLAVVAAVVLVGWITDAGGTASAGAAIRLAADAWLLGHGGVLHLPTGSVDAVPLGLTALAAGLLYRAGVSVAGSLPTGPTPAGPTPAGPALGPPARALAGLAGLYGLAAAAVAQVAGTPAARVGWLSAGLGAALLAAVAGGAGMVRAAGLGGPLAAALPRWVPPVARAAAVAVGALLAAGAGLAAAALAAHTGRAAELTRSLDPGAVGGVLLLAVGVLLVPNGAVWAAGYLAGPGFAVGAGTGVSPFGIRLGPVPALPMLAGLPQGDAPAEWSRALLLLPLLAGVLAGLAVARAVGPQEAPGWARRRAGYGMAAGLVAGAALAGLAVLAGGSVGGGYLTAVGPSPWRLGLAVAVEVGVPAGLTAGFLPPRRPAGPTAGAAAGVGPGGAGAAAPDPPAVG
jgi:hypothetical protein